MFVALRALALVVHLLMELAKAIAVVVMIMFVAQPDAILNFMLVSLRAVNWSVSKLGQY